MNRLICFTALLLVLPPTDTNAAENPTTSAGSPSSLKDAEAWNIKVERRFEFPAAIGDLEIRYGAPTFSHDFRRVLYVVGEPFRDPSAFNPYNNKALHSFLAVRSLESTEILKKIPLAGSFRSMADKATVAFSPDEKKALLGPVWFQDEKRGLLFIDLESSKITPVPIDSRASIERITWPETTYISLSSQVGLNLDTLKTFDISPEQYKSTIKPLEFHTSKHEKCFIALLKSPDWPPNYSDDRRRPNDLVVTTTGKYAIVVEPSFAEGAGAAAIGADTLTAALEGRTIWSPDLKYILFRTSTKISSGSYAFPLVLLELGLRPTPQLDFGIGQLDESLSNSQRQQIKRSFSAGKKVWARVYGRKVNPLNDKLLGPDKAEFRGLGYLTEIEPKFKFKFTYEKLPANAGNVVATFQVVNEWNWDDQTWGELVKFGERDDSALDTGVANQLVTGVAQQTKGAGGASSTFSDNSTVNLARNDSAQVAVGDSSATETNIAQDSRTFEMRTYYAAPGKLEALNARFRDHACRLFKKHGIELIGFWIPTDKEKGAENTLVYILAHKSREAAKKSYADFGNDPEWKRARDASEAKGKLVEKIESVFLDATDYSSIK